MTMTIDTITRRKLILVKQLYQQAENQSALDYSVSNRIISLIGFDLTVETLLKVLVGTLDQRKSPAEQFGGLLDQCDDLLTRQGLTSLPYRAQILHMHSLRNDAQHKAKYPNETDVSDCRTYTRDFCQDVVHNIWNISFTEISPIEWIDDTILRNLLTVSATDIQAGNLKKGLALAGMAFTVASACIRDVLPPEADGLYGGQIPELKSNTVEYVNGVLKRIENSAKRYAAMMSTGIDPVDYKRFRASTPPLTFNYSSDINTPGVRSLKIQVYWQNKNPDQQSALWSHDFVVNAVINWQLLGLSPRIQNNDALEQVNRLIQWDSSEIMLL